MKHLAISLFALSGLSAPLALAQEEAPQITHQDLGSGVYMMVGQGGNIGILAGADGVFVIDSQYLNIAPANLAKISEIAGSAPTYLVNTHWHGDHTGGNAAFGGMIMAHENVRGRLSEDREITRGGNTSTSEAVDPANWPVITFNEGLDLHLNGQTINVFHTPTAHTDGDAMVYFEEANILHMGDVFFNGIYPFVDTGSGGTFDGYISAMELAYSLADNETQIIPGHGPLAGKADLGDSIEMLKGVRSAVVDAIAAGMTMEDAMEADILAEWNGKWGNAFIQPNFMIGLAWGDLEPKVVTAAPATGRGS